MADGRFGGMAEASLSVSVGGAGFLVVAIIFRLL